MSAMAGDRPILTFDFDGVLCRPPLGINFGNGKNKPRDREGHNNLLWRTELWRYAMRKPMPGARDGFLAFAESYDCRVISARAEKARPFSERWFRRNFGMVPQMHLRPHWAETPAQFKVRTIQELRPLAHFEDDPHTAEWLAELIPAVFLVDWRRNRWLSGERIHRISCLADAAPILASLRDEERV